MLELLDRKVGSGGRGAAAGGKITISDDGPGVPDAACARIFDSCFTTRPDAQGAGLGSNTARTLIGGRHGTLALTPGGAKGATFAVRLPLTGDRE